MTGVNMGQMVSVCMEQGPTRGEEPEVVACGRFQNQVAGYIGKSVLAPGSDREWVWMHLQYIEIDWGCGDPPGKVRNRNWLYEVIVSRWGRQDEWKKEANGHGSIRFL